MIEVKPVLNSKDRKAFLEFPVSHYKDSPNWVPPLWTVQKEILGFSSHPFYENAEIKHFVCYDEGKHVGQIAGIVDHGHNQHHDEKRGMFGFFESVDRVEVAQSLFRAVEEWLKEKGMRCARGPNSPSLNHQYSGCLLNGFDKDPTFMMPYNKPYYARLIAACGYRKSQDLLAFLGHLEVKELDPLLFEIVDQTKQRLEMTIRPWHKGKKFKDDVEAFLSLYNNSLLGKWGFVPMTDSEVRHVADGLGSLVLPDLTTVIEVKGKPVAIAFGLLDYNPIIKKIKGKLFPFGLLRLLFSRKNLKKIRIVGAFVVPEYQRWGLSLVLISRLLPDMQKWGIEEVEFSYVVESNRQSRKTLERAGAVLERTFRMFDKDLSFS